MKNSGAKEGFTDKIIDFFFSSDVRKWLIPIFILGLVLRIVVASNLPPVADEMVHGVHAIGISKLAPLSTTAQAQIWYYLTDYGYRLFGVHLLTARLLSVIFGSLSILVVYLLGELIFNKKTGVVAAFLLAISCFHITWAASYQDQTMMFFVLLASYFFMKTYKEKKEISLLSALFLGIALLVKVITGVFIVVFGVAMVFILFRSYKTDRKRFVKNLKRAIVFGFILFCAALPILSYNYFLYKEKGIVDLAFAQFLRINAEFYTGPGLAHGEGFVLHKLPHNLYLVATHYFLKEDPLISLLAAGGLVLLLLHGKRLGFERSFIIGMALFALLFIASAIVLNTHYTSFIPFMALFGAFFIYALANTSKKFKRPLVYSILIIALILNVFLIKGALSSQSAVEKMRSFTEERIDQNTLVVVDSRIYTGTTVWMFNDKAYVDAVHLPVLLQSSNASGTIQPIRTLFIECVVDDCGWGTIGSQPQANQSMEGLVSQFSAASKSVQDITGGGSLVRVRGQEIPGEPFFRIYETALPLNPQILSVIKQTHNHFFYHIPRYEFAEQAFDHYRVHGFFDNTLNVISYTILYVLLILAVLSTAIPFYCILRRK